MPWIFQKPSGTDEIEISESGRISTFLMCTYRRRMRNCAATTHWCARIGVTVWTFWITIRHFGCLADTSAGRFTGRPRRSGEGNHREIREIGERESQGDQGDQGEGNHREIKEIRERESQGDQGGQGEGITGRSRRSGSLNFKFLPDLLISLFFILPGLLTSLF